MATQLTNEYQRIGTSTYTVVGNNELRLYAKYNSQNREANKSNVTFQLRTIATSGYYYSAGNWSNLNVGGDKGTQYYDIGTVDTNSEKSIGTWTFDVAHDNSGNYSNTASASANVYGDLVPTVSGEFSLPQIKRASTLNSVSTTIASNGQSITITPRITKNVNTYYDVFYLFDVNTGTIWIKENAIDNTTYTITDQSVINQIYSRIGTETSKGLPFASYVVTYTDSTKTTYLGTSNTGYPTFTVPSYTISTTATITDTVTTYNTYKGSGNQNKIYIANLSKPKFDFTTTSSTGSFYGLTPSYKLNNNTVTDPYTENNFTGQSFTFNITDGRQSTTYTPSSSAFTSIPYFTPTLTTTVKRPTPTGSTATVNVSGKFYKGTGLTNLATPTMTFKYTESGGSEQTITITLTTTDSGNTTNFTGSATLTGLNYQKSITWSSILKDKINITTNNSGQLPQGLPVFHAYRKNDENNFNVLGNLTATKFYDRPWDFNTENTTDTWIPVAGGGKWQHRVISKDLNNRGVKSLTSVSHSGWGTNNNYLPDMSFMAYWNGAHNSSNASNLTYAYQGTIQCKPKSLYDNSSGTNGTVTLSQTSANFSVLDIYYKHTNDGSEYNCTRVWSPNGKRACLETSWGFTENGTAGCQTVQKNVNISGTSITNHTGRAFNVSPYGNTWASSTTADIYVVKVLGYKY